MEGDDDRNSFGIKGYRRAFERIYYFIEAPVVWFRKTIVEPNQQNYPWYHEKKRRVPTIDQCYQDDVCCIFEANQQFIRDKKVDNQILAILRRRLEDCNIYEMPDALEKCAALSEYYEMAATNWFIKYGDLGAYGGAEDAYNKQKHRMVWERRHGPVGTGTRESRAEKEREARQQEELQ